MFMIHFSQILQDVCSLSFLLAAIAHVYCSVITETGEILGDWRKFLKKHLIPVTYLREENPDALPKDLQPDETMFIKHYTDKNGKLKQKKVQDLQWFYDPLIGCEKCFAGQLALWTYLILNFHSYSLFNHLAVVCMTILIAKINSIIFPWLKRKTEIN